MTIFKRLRGATILATVVALGAMAVPSSALAGKVHVLKLYKVERHLDVEGDEEYTVKCKSGDIATDGMWRIDDVGQDEDFDLLGQYNETIPTAAYPVDTDSNKKPDAYKFRFLPLAGGDVSAKLWVTCIEDPIASNGHTHALRVKMREKTETDVTAPGITGDYQNVNGGATTTPVDGFADAAACTASRYVLIAPGFQFDPDAPADEQGGYAYLMMSKPYSSGGITGWQWRWYVRSASTDPNSAFRVKHYWSCLRLKTDAGGSPSHVHRLVVVPKTTTPPVIKGRQIAERQLSCGDHYKGMVGGFDIAAYGKLYYLGMDPRIKTRAFKFVNTDPAPPTAVLPAHSHGADLYLTCFKDKTT